MSEFIPKGYDHITTESEDGENSEYILNRESGHHFIITNRSFQTVDHRFSNFPSKTLDYMLKEDGYDDIAVLDIGGGIEARASGDIAEQYKNYDDLAIYSLDLTANPNTRGGRHQIVGDALEMPIKSNSIDIALSTMSVSEVVSGDPELLKKALLETARVLKPGGVFFLDKVYSKQLEQLPDPDQFAHFEEEMEVVFYTKEFGFFYGLYETLIQKLNNTYPDWKFLIMVKKPVNEDLIKELALQGKNKIV